MIEWQEESVEKVLICLTEPNARRLAAFIKQRFALEAQTVDVPRADMGNGLWVVAAEYAEAAIAVADSGKVAVLFGTRTPTADEQSRLKGAALIVGALPGALLPWLEEHLTAVGPQEDAPWEETASPKATDRGQSIAVYSSGGGVGKTTTAVHLAVAATAVRLVTGLVELDEDRRGILTHFDRRPKVGLDTLDPSEWEAPERFAQAMERVAVPVNPRLSVVPMVGTKYGMQYQSSVETEDHLPRLFDWTERRFALSIYDLPARVRDHVVLSALRRASRVVIVVEPTEIMVDSMMSYLELIQSIKGVGGQIIGNMRLLVNKVPRGRRVALPPKQVAEALGLPLLGEVPMEPERYMGGINRHQVALDANWREIFESLGIGQSGTTRVIPRLKRPEHGGLGKLFHRR